MQSVHKLIVVNLTAADKSRFETYERKVIPLLDKYGGRMQSGVRSVDGMTETHILFFPDVTSFEAFLSDPVRTQLQGEWQLTGATTTITDVIEVGYI